MKKILLVLALVFGFFVMSYAQNMVTKLVFPATFDKIVYTTCNNSGSISSIDSGASAYWDLSSFGVLTDSITEEYLNVPAGDKIKFPAANVMIKQLAYNYETKTYLNRIELTGEITKVGEIRNSMNYEAKYTTNKSYIQFPLLFQSSSTKSFVYTYTGAIENGTKTGSNKYDVPGFGRLKMPDGTIYDSVYLIISTELTLETGKSPGKSETFWWYSNKYKGPIAVVTYFYGYNSSSSSFIKPPPSVIFQKKPMEAPKPSNVIQTVALKFAIYPNPAVSTTTIKSDVIITSLTVISIDGKAQIVKENVESKDVVLDVSAIKSGIYFIRITDSNGNMGIRKIYIHK